MGEVERKGGKNKELRIEKRKNLQLSEAWSRLHETVGTGREEGLLIGVC